MYQKGEPLVKVAPSPPAFVWASAWVVAALSALQREQRCADENVDGHFRVYRETICRDEVYVYALHLLYVYACMHKGLHGCMYMA